MKKAAKKRKAGRPRATDLQEHREALLDAATELFMEKGFAKASTDEIARRANASKGTLYALYPSKAELYGAILQRRVAKAIDPLGAQPIPEAAPAEDTLRAFGQGVLRHVNGDEAQTLYRLIVSETGADPSLGVALWENGPGRGRAVLKQFLDSQVERRVLQIEDTDQAALQFLGMTFGMILLRGSLRLPKLCPTPEAERKWVDSIVSAFLRAYRA